jgi:hypothetical protein
MATITFDTLNLARGPEAVGDLRRQLRESELRLENKIEATKAEILKWMFGAMAAQTGIIVALLKLLP